jgi:hypothetical protein
MTDLDMEQLRYPVGRLDVKPSLTPEQRARCIDQIEALPEALVASVAHLDDAQLDTPYRPGGWTVRQVVHHLPDSHLNSYVRFKLGATEDEPRITTYEELHERWVLWLRAQGPEVWSRGILHPEMGSITLDQLLQVYCWHSRHHLAHIDGLKKREGWT